jgi:hypothetical protein
MSKIHGEIDDAPRNKQGKGYMYADLAQILTILRPLWAKHGVSVMQLPLETVDGYARLKTIITKGDEQITEVTSCFIEQVTNRDGRPINSMVQCQASTNTYLRRLVLSSAFGIGQVDDDGAYPETAPQARQEPAPVRPSLPPRPPQESRPDGITQEQATKVWGMAKVLWPESPKDGVVGWLVAHGYPNKSTELTSEQAVQVIRMLDAEIQL